MKRAVLMKIPQPVKEEPLTSEELLAKANTLIEEKVSKNVQRQYWKCLNPGCPVETEKKYKPVKDPENPTKKISFFKHHQKYCAFIPEDDLETKRKKEEACIRVAQGKKGKEAKKKRNLKFECPYKTASGDQCTKTYASFKSPYALRHLRDCEFRNDDIKLAFMKQKGLV